MNAAAWFAASSFHDLPEPRSAVPTVPKPVHVSEGWDDEAGCWRTYYQWADGTVTEEQA